MENVAHLMMVTYNRVELTKQTLDCLSENTHFPHDYVIIDNGSSDNTISFLKEYFADIKNKAFKGFTIIENKINKGIAVGRNQALKCAAGLPGDWFVTIDNDVWVPNNWLTQCVDILLKNKSYAGLGVNMEGQSYPTVTMNGFQFQSKPRGNLGTACMVFNRTLHKMLGFFNCTDYGKYGLEDSDFGARVRVVGLKLGYIQEHGKHLGEGELDVGEYRAFKTKTHDAFLNKFNENCRLYYNHLKPIYMPFADES